MFHHIFEAHLVYSFSKPFASIIQRIVDKVQGFFSTTMMQTPASMSSTTNTIKLEQTKFIVALAQSPFPTNLILQAKHQNFLLEVEISEMGIGESESFQSLFAK